MRPQRLGALSHEARIATAKNEVITIDMLTELFKLPHTLEALRERATDGIRTWLTGFAPGLVPERPDPAADDPTAAGWMRRFARDVITTNPVSRSPLSSVHVYLIELVLECVDWPALARDRRLRDLDWSRASLVYPRIDRGAARLAGPAPRPVEVA